MKVLNEKAKTAPSQADNMRYAISSLLTVLVNNGEIKQNFLLGLPEFTDDNTRDRYYTFDEIVEIWNEIETFKEPYNFYYKMLFLTAQRKTETMKMKWSHIDKESMVWTIPEELAKNNNEHHVPITDQIIKVLNELKARQSKKCEYVFTKNNSKQPIKNVTRYSKKIKDNTSVKDFRNHDLRRTASTQMGNLGVFPFVIGRLLNHKEEGENTGVSAGYNWGDYMTEKREALKKWDEYLIKYVTAEKLKKAQTNIKAKGVKYSFDGKLKEHSFEEKKEDPEITELKKKAKF